MVVEAHKVTSDSINVDRGHVGKGGEAGARLVGQKKERRHSRTFIFAVHNWFILECLAVAAVRTSRVEGPPIVQSLALWTLYKCTILD